MLGQFAYDVSQREKMTNKDLAHELHKLGYIDAQGNFTWSNFKFLEKTNVNGVEMHELFRFMKRNSPDLFIPRYGMAQRIHEYNTRFLLDRYGQVRHTYSPSVELAVIE